MQAAQKLYEAGHITYMRTDSNTLSEIATKSIAEVISMNYGNQYSKTRIYSTKSKNAQQAHEAVRPTNFSNKVLNLDSDQTNLYNLIWKRTVASQMSDAILDKTIVKINSNNHDGIFQSEGEVIKFDGFL